MPTYEYPQSSRERHLAGVRSFEQLCILLLHPVTCSVATNSTDVVVDGFVVGVDTGQKALMPGVNLVFGNPRTTAV